MQIEFQKDSLLSLIIIRLMVIFFFHILIIADKAKVENNHKVILSNTIRVVYKKNISDLSSEANLYVQHVPNTVSPKEF